ncbi:AMP-binding protein [Parasphingopyxis lamellibrachiae]|uniref:Acyl-CoA synthetase (AMP-forming)/AMP-acid ligase II n=1 Tax=Parasphingopyxis lamellibrachiae TaxID=680125 RepID=A0A3D9FH65_9SPHN|nr:AMP-binding protein [Parasphingopyxis lamellibrachiae]RED16426.1 acyl-CoA synthetase (AMP-forming)/AMP-acid ligase II [Parasphingopyxis lamellibrachiae]
MNDGTNIWNYANIWESIAAAQPLENAVVQGEDTVSWGEFDRQADGLANFLVDQGLEQGASVAVYSPNRAEFLVGYFAAFKAGLTPLNINYRYTSSELAYLIDNADAKAVLFDIAYAKIIEEVRETLGTVTRWIAIGADEDNCPDWAARYEEAVATAPASRPYEAPWGRSNKDLLMIYTGGTTGMPKGVMWRLHDLLAKSEFGAVPMLGVPPLERPEDAGPRAVASPIKSRSLIAPPLMHATGLLTSFAALVSGGTVILLPTGKFSAEEMLDIAARHKATRCTIVGEPFAQPLLAALDAEPGRWDLSSLLLMTSSGAMWTRETKLGLIRHMPQVNLIDSYSSSEALGMGMSVTNAQGETETARFETGETCAVFTEDHRRIEPGSGEKGMLAVGGYCPIGYYKDEEKSAKTFPVIDGERWSMPGDWAMVNEDGTLEILGRGSQCINSGGEKIFPEEVEEALRRHEAVRDVAVTGLPDPRWGERICAVVELMPGAENPGDVSLADWVHGQLADYKTPRSFVYVESVGRAPNGKLDYKAIKQTALEAEEKAIA